MCRKSSLGTLCDDTWSLFSYLRFHRQSFGSPLLRLDLVPSTFKIPASVHKRDFFSWLFGTSTTATSVAGVKTLGALAEFPYAPRNSDAGVSSFTNKRNMSAHIFNRILRTTDGVLWPSMVLSQTARL